MPETCSNHDAPPLIEVCHCSAWSVLMCLRCCLGRRFTGKEQSTDADSPGAAFHLLGNADVCVVCLTEVGSTTLKARRRGPSIHSENTQPCVSALSRNFGT
eukprot:56716-Eustigmatos_ZCMA.PRE.3